jgi:ribosome assembly protein YihI (activator of Der GTPase)
MYDKGQHSEYIDTLIDLIDAGELSTKDASAQYWADWQMDKINEMEYFKEEM